MGLKDLLKGIITVQELQELPKRVAALEQKVAILEKTKGASSQKMRSMTCPSCGDMSYRIINTETAKFPHGDMGLKDVTRQCENCGHRDTHLEE